MELLLSNEQCGILLSASFLHPLRDFDQMFPEFSKMFLVEINSMYLVGPQSDILPRTADVYARRGSIEGMILEDIPCRDCREVLDPAWDSGFGLLD